VFSPRPLREFELVLIAVQDIIEPSSLASAFFNRISGHQTDTVVAVKHTVLAIAWLGINQTVGSSIHVIQLHSQSPPKLEPSVQQHLERPKRFWFGPDLSKLILLRTRIENHLRAFERVEFKDKTNSPFTVYVMIYYLI
jgi:ubiquitin-conjugating enzyme E2 O